jgi:hypothetical protein
MQYCLCASLTIVPPSLLLFYRLRVCVQVERVCSALYAFLGYFHQCHTLVATVEPSMRDLQVQCTVLQLLNFKLNVC